GRKVVVLHPSSRAYLVPDVLDPTLLERQELGIVVLEIGVAQAVEIVAPDVDRQLGAPIAVFPFPNDFGSWPECIDRVWTRAERRLQCRLSYVAYVALGIRAFPPMFGQDRKVSHYVGQF